jgi:hypothetical protein
MKMKYIIFTALLVLLLGVQGRGQGNVHFSSTNGSSSLSSVEFCYGDEIKDSGYKLIIPTDGSYWKQGTIYIGHWNNGDKYGSEANAALRYIVQAASPSSDPINFRILLPSTNGTQYHLWFKPNNSNDRTPAQSITFKVSPRPVTVDEDGFYYVRKYDGSNVVDVSELGAIPLKNIVAGDDVAVDVKSAEFDDKNVGTNKTILVLYNELIGSKSSNYTFDDANNTVAKQYVNTKNEITAKDITLNLDFTKVYDGTTDAKLENKTFTHADNTDIIEGEEIEISSVTGIFASANASENELSVNNIRADYENGDDHSNYAITFTGKGKINKQSLSLSLSDKFVYENSKIGTDIIFQKPKNVDGTFELYKGNVQLDYNNGDNLGVGNYRVVFKPNDENNYNSVDKEFEVEPKKLSLTINFEKEYDGNNTVSINDINSYSYSFSNKLLNDEVQIESLVATFDNKNASTGFTKKVSVRDVVLSNSNYKVEDFEKENIGKINKKKITPNFTFQKIYDGNAVATNSLTNEFEDKKLTHSNCDAILEGDEVNFDFSGATFAMANKHTNGVVTIEGLQLSDNNSNYEIDGYTSSGTITAQPITISLSGSPFTYGNSIFDTDIEPSVSATSPAIDGTFKAHLKNSTIDYSVGTMLPAGEYTISYTPKDATNYEVTNNNEIEFTVVKKKIDVVLIFEKTYDGDNIAYDNVNNKSFLKSETILTHNQYTGILENDQIKFTLDRANFSKADCHTDEVVACENLKFLNGNYNVNPVVIGTIKQRPVNVELYFEKEYDGTNVATNKLKEKYIKDGDITLSSNVVDFQFTTATFESENASLTNTQNVTLDNAAGLTNANYSISERSVTGKILPKNIEIGLNTGSPFTYGGSKLGTDIIPTITDNVSGVFKFNDMTFPDNSMIPVGNYRIKFTPDQPTNYTVTNNESVSFEVTQKVIESITLSYNPNKTYDATDEVLDFSCSEIKGLLGIDNNNDKITVSAKYKDKKADDNAVIELLISPSDFVKQNYSCVGAEILNSGGVLGTVNNWTTFDFEIKGVIYKRPINLTSDYATQKEYNSSDNVKDFTVTAITATKSNNEGSNINFSPTEGYKGYFFAGDEIEIIPTAKYNSKNVSEAEKITIDATINSENYDVIPVDFLGAKITKKEINISQDETYKVEKYYDGTDVIVGGYKVNDYKSDIYNNEVQVGLSVRYSNVNASVSDIPLVVVPSFEGSDVEKGNYQVNIGNFTGKIMQIAPDLEWYDAAGLVEDPSKGVVLLPTEKVGTANLYADLKNDDKFGSLILKNYYPAKIYQYSDDDGTTFKQLSTADLAPGEYVAKAVFNPNDNVNFKPCVSTIKFTVSKLELTASHKIETDVYGAKIGTDIYFYAVNENIDAISDLEYTYFLDDQKVKNGFIPKAGKHKLYCVISDKKNNFATLTTYILDLDIKPVGLYTTDFEWSEAALRGGQGVTKSYDGTSEVFDWQIGKRPLIENTHHIVKGDEVVLLSTQVYDDLEVGNRKVTVSKYLEGKDAYCYYIIENEDYNYHASYTYPGYIMPCKVVVDFKDHEKIYGESVLGVDISATVAKVLFKGEYISVPGKYEYCFPYSPDGKEYFSMESGEMLEVGSYNAWVVFEPEDQLNYNSGRSKTMNITVLPKPVYAGGVSIADKYYDGTAKIAPSQVSFSEPVLDGVLEKDKTGVKLIFDEKRLEYPSHIVGDYKDIPVYVSLSGNAIANYKLENQKLTANSSILPFEFVYNIEPDETGIYQLIYGTSVLGKDLKIVNDLTETQSVKYMVLGIDKTDQMLVPNTYKTEVRLYDSGVLIQTKTVTVNVAKLKLVASEPEIAHVKLYDGNSNVLLTGKMSRLLNVVENDDVRITSQTQWYDDANIGSGKTITVNFTLAGTWENNYIAPDGYLYEDGVITTKDFKITSLGVSGSICPNSEVPLVFSIDEGMPHKMSVTFSEEALSCGFENFSLTGQTNFGYNSVNLKIPETAKPGTYQATLSLFSSDGTGIDETFYFTVNYPPSYIVAKFNDVVAVDNSGFDFIGYQWFKDEEVVEPENKQFFNDKPCLYGWYSAKVLTVDGSYAEICPHYFDKRNAVSKAVQTVGVKVYPNPASAFRPVTIELEGFEDYTGVTVYVYNSNGVLVQTLKNAGRLNTVSLPQGTYTGAVEKDGARVNFKLVVKK